MNSITTYDPNKTTKVTKAISPELATTSHYGFTLREDDREDRTLTIEVQYEGEEPNSIDHLVQRTGRKDSHQSRPQALMCVARGTMSCDTRFCLV